MTGTLHYVDATETEHRETLSPMTVQQLEEKGFRVLGRIAVLSAPAATDRLFDPAERVRLNAWRSRPAFTLLAAPDGSAYASVDTYGDAPMVRMRTVLEDGSLVETIGLAPEGRLRLRIPFDPYAWITFVNAADRSTRLIHDASAWILVPTHAEHLREVTERRGSRPVLHNDRGDALRLWKRAASHGMVCGRRARWSLILVPITIVTCLAIALPLATLSLSALDPDSVPLVVFFTIGIGALLLRLAIPQEMRLSKRITRAHWWRPHFAEPRPRCRATDRPVKASSRQRSSRRRVSSRLLGGRPSSAVTGSGPAGSPWAS